MSITYEGIVFKNPPAVDMAEYPYMFMWVKPSLSYAYRLTLSKDKYFYQSSDDTLRPGSSNKVKNYWMTDEMARNSSDWELRNTSDYYYDELDPCLYSANYNIPIGSASGTEYYMKHNMELPTLLNQFQNSSNGPTSCTLSMSGCEVGNLLVAAYAVRGADNVVVLSDGWNVLGGGNNTSDAASLYQRMFFASKIAESGTETLTVTQTGTGRIYIVAAEFCNVSVAEIRNNVSNIGSPDFTVKTEKPSEESIMLYAVSSAYYATGGGRQQTADPSDLIKVLGDSSQERLACWFDFGGGAISHTFRTTTNTGSRDAIVEAVELFPEKISYHTTGHADYLVTGAERVHSSTDSNISWTFEAPEGTACDVLVKIGDGDFLTAENGGRIPGLADGTDLASTPMTVRVALSTENPEVTPVFHALSLWIADEADKNVISLHFPEGNQNSVQNAADPITVAYNGATLAGEGGFVQAFELDCPIEGLEYKGDQNDAEHIEINSIKAAGTLKRVYYSEYSAPDEHIKIGSIKATGVLTHVDNI